MCPQVANVNDPLYSDKQHLYFQLDFFNPDPANPGKISGSEDCLFLNIYTRNLPSTDMTSTTPLRWAKTFCFDVFATVWSFFIFIIFFCHSPVLFYIHGGGFAMGSGAGIFGEISNLISLLLTPGMENSAEDYFMESDIVLVTINYRLGPLGFMAIPGTNIQVLHNLEDQGQPSCIRGIFFL